MIEKEIAKLRLAWAIFLKQSGFESLVIKILDFILRSLRRKKRGEG